MSFPSTEWILIPELTPSPSGRERQVYDDPTFVGVLLRPSHYR